jgi:hypothetical protein
VDFNLDFFWAVVVVDAAKNTGAAFESVRKTNIG